MLNGSETTFTVSKNGAERCLTDTNGLLKRCVGLGEEAVGIKRCEERVLGLLNKCGKVIAEPKELIRIY